MVDRIITEEGVEAAGLSRRWRSIGFRVATAGLLLGFVAATNRWMSWDAGFRLLLPRDEADYRVIASAAPHLPSIPLPEQHAQRFPFHYVIGLLAHAFGLSVEHTYRIAVLVLAVVLCLLVAAVLASIGVSDAVFAVCVAVFALNTYSLRYYGIAPGMMVDLMFEAGLLIMLSGLVRRSYLVVMIGLLVSSLARQSAVPASLAVGAWMYLGPGWRQADRWLRMARGGSAVVVSAAVFAILARVAAPFSAGTTPDFSHWTLLSDLERLPSGLGQLGQHFLRAANGLFSVAALILVAALALKRDPRSGVNRLPAEFWWCLLLTALVVVQPVIFSPEYAAHNETRLTVLALPPLICALAFLLRDLERRGRRTTATSVATMIAILAIGSLHHLYTVTGTASAQQTVVLQAITAVCLGTVLWFSLRLPPTPSVRASPGTSGPAV